MDALRRWWRARRPRRAPRWSPACDALEGRRLPAARPLLAAVSPVTDSPTTTTRSEFGTTFAADLKTLQLDLNALVVDIQADTYAAQAFQADLQQVMQEATKTPSQALKLELIEDLIATEDGYSSGAQIKQVNADFTAFLQAEGITDQALITKTIADQQALVRTAELPNTDLVRVVLDRRALANDLGFGAEKYSSILNAGPGESLPASGGASASTTKAARVPGVPTSVAKAVHASVQGVRSLAQHRRR